MDLSALIVTLIGLVVPETSPLQPEKMQLLSGITVKVTLGPKGRAVILEKTYGAPTVTRDGVTIAKEIELRDHFENIGAQLIKEVASKTGDIAGDGTNSCAFLSVHFGDLFLRLDDNATTSDEYEEIACLAEEVIINSPT